MNIFQCIAKTCGHEFPSSCVTRVQCPKCGQKTERVLVKCTKCGEMKFTTAKGRKRENPICMDCSYIIKMEQTKATWQQKLLNGEVKAKKQPSKDPMFRLKVKGLSPEEYYAYKDLLMDDALPEDFRNHESPRVAIIAAHAFYTNKELSLAALKCGTPGEARELIDRGLDWYYRSGRLPVGRCDGDSYEQV